MKALTKQVFGLVMILCGLGTDAVTAQTTTAPTTTDTSVADMFSTTPEGSQPTTAPTGTNSPADLSATTPASFELRAGESVYRSVEEAQRGIEHKDSLINLLRQQAIQSTGVDPLTGQRVGQPGQMTQMGQPQAPVRYIDNPNQYATDLSAAAQLGAQTGDYTKYHSIQRQFQREQAEEQFAPVMPVLNSFVEHNAVQQVSAVNPEFGKFYNSPDWKKTLDANPLLRMGIENAKQNFQFANQLPELYKQVYVVAENARLRAQVAEFQKAQQTPQQVVRPTAQPTSSQPNVSNVNTQDWRTNPEARKAFIEQQKQAGIENVTMRLS